MLVVDRYVFKRADKDEEFEGIHRLNYRTFVSEIPQHPDPGTGRLVDKFHDRNVYFIALRDGRLVGMVSAHGQPPFSVAPRLPDPAILTRQGSRPLEVRLLAIEPEERHGTVLLGLLWLFYQYMQDHGYTDLYISGLMDRMGLYERLGFVPLGPAVPSGNALFVPMCVQAADLHASTRRFEELWVRHMRRVARPRASNGQPSNGRALPVCLLPGPVATAADVQAAFQEPAIYHRGVEFIDRFEEVRQQLSDLVGGRDVAILNGSGTLGNETVAGTLAVAGGPGRGLVLVNGEFGLRLAGQATRFGLNPRILSWPWGKPWDLDAISDVLAEEPAGSWVWGVHLESSTGVLNDLPVLVERARAHGIRVCMDCISSLGAVPIDLREVYLASAATGKSLGAFAGAAIVFADAGQLAHLDRRRLPTYLDLYQALNTRGPRFTFPSPVLRALETALARYATPDRARSCYQHYASMGSYVRGQLRRLGLPPLADEDCACPVVTTFAPPAGESSEAFVARCRSWGFAIGGQSSYLAERRLVQIATMGAVIRPDCEPLFDQLASWLSRSISGRLQSISS